MKSKRYSTVKITDPMTENHTVRLFPNQNMLVRLSAVFGPFEVSTNSDLLRLVSTEKKDNGDVIYEFAQRYNLQTWSKISRAFLGEIIILGKEISSNLCVVLESADKEKNRVVTVVNPKTQAIKVDIDQVIELVFYHPEGINSWSLKSQQLNGFCYEQIGYQELIPDDWPKCVNPRDIYCTFPRTLGNKPVREHHMWLRCTSQTLEKAQSKLAGVYPAGRLIIDSNRANFDMDLNVNIRSKNTRFFKSLLIPHKGQEATAIPTTQGQKSTKSTGHIVGKLAGKKKNKRYKSYSTSYTDKKFWKSVSLEQKDPDECEFEDMEVDFERYGMFGTGHSHYYGHGFCGID